MNPNLIIQYDPKVIEAAVCLAQRDSYIARDLEERRSRIHDEPDAEERERLFLDLYRAWFHRLGLGKPIEKVLGEQATIAALVGSCYIVSATQAEEERAELFVVSNPASDDRRRRALRVVIRPESLLQPEAILTFLRHELLHIAEMLDPAVAYEPALQNA